MTLNYVPAYASKAEEKGVITERNKYETPGFGFNVGVKVGATLTRFMTIETGIDYSQLSYIFKSDPITFSGHWTNPSYVAPGSFTSVTQIDRYNYLNIPVAFNFFVGKGKIRAVISTGAAFNVLIKKTITTNYYNGKTRTHTFTGKDSFPFNQYNLSPFLGVGIDYNITNLIVLRIMPIAQMQALKNINTPITEHLFSGGISMSLLFNLPKATPKGF